ncbi:carboxylesterase/lipase family protein [Microterricola viridarii]|nr:carboxylesterase family protein [Microterricola viridarii]
MPGSHPAPHGGGSLRWEGRTSSEGEHMPSAMQVPHANTSAGALSGIRLTTPHGPVEAFLGVPYATLGPGRLRFAPGRAPDGWAGVRDCSRPGPAVPQNPSPFGSGADSPSSHQDDLHGLNLNIWAPAGAKRGRPVLVWVHGGANIIGSNAEPLHDGAALAADGDLVVVAVNYRLGVFGFLHLERATHGSGLSNGAVHDLITALRWVRDEIAQFGGDPSNVTIGGQSAGAALVGTLLGVPTATGLFHRAIMQSGTAERVHSPAEASAVTCDILRHLGIDGSEASTVFDRPTSELLAAQSAVCLEYESRTVGLSVPFQPVVDGTLLPASPLDAVRAGLNSTVDLLIGTNRNEASLSLAFGPPRDPKELARTLRGEIAADLGGVLGPEQYVRAVQSDVGQRPSEAEALEAYLSDRSYRQPSNRLLEARLGGEGLNFSYLFDWASPAMNGRLGACHGAELPFVFGTLDRPAAAFFVGTQPPPELSSRMMTAWAAFARTGRPGSWATYREGSRHTQVWDENPIGRSDPRPALRALWSTVPAQSRLA